MHSPAHTVGVGEVSAVVGEAVKATPSHKLQNRVQVLAFRVNEHLQSSGSARQIAPLAACRTYRHV